MTISSRQGKNSGSPGSQTIWFGTLVGLLAMLWSINLLPPIPVRYSMSAHILATPARVKQLESYVASGSSAKNGGRIVSVKVLTKKSASETPIATTAAGVIPNVLVVEVTTEWNRKITVPVVQQWLEEVSKPTRAAIAELPAQKDARWAAWKLKSLEHYSRTTQSDSSESSSTNNPTASSDASESSDKSQASNEPFPSLIGLKEKSEGIESASPTMQTASFVHTAKKATDSKSSDIKNALSQAEQAARKASLIAEQERAEQTGFVTLNRLTSLKPVTHSVSLFHPMMSCMIGGVAAIIAMITLRRSQAPRVPSRVRAIEMLKQFGVPLIGVNRVFDGSQAVTVASNVISATVRWYHPSRWTSMMELSLMMWVAAMMIRFCCDPMWRGLVIAQPLAAFGRLLWGMP